MTTRASKPQLPRIVCIDCMRDVEVLYREDFDVMNRGWLVRVRCACVDTFAQVVQHEEIGFDDRPRPMLLGDLRPLAFDQDVLERYEREAMRLMQRVDAIQAFMRECHVERTP